MFIIAGNPLELSFQESKDKHSKLCAIQTKILPLGAKLRYIGYFASLLHPQEETGLQFSVWDVSCGHRNPRFTKFKFSIVSF